MLQPAYAASENSQRSRSNLAACSEAYGTVRTVQDAFNSLRSVQAMFAVFSEISGWQLLADNFWLTTSGWKWQLMINPCWKPRCQIA